MNVKEDEEFESRAMLVKNAARQIQKIIDGWPTSDQEELKSLNKHQRREMKWEYTAICNGTVKTWMNLVHTDRDNRRAWH